MQRQKLSSLSMSICRNCFRLRKCMLSTSSNNTWRQNPPPNEATELNKLFPQPQRILLDLLDPVIDVDKSLAPKVEHEQRMQGQLWKAKMSLKWPTTFTVNGVSDDKHRAEHYAYLLACRMVQELGLLDKTGQSFDYVEKLFNYHEQICKGMNPDHVLCYKSNREFHLKEPVWKSRLELSWPFNLDAEDKGRSKDKAERNATALVFCKLKAKGLLGKEGNPQGTALCCLPKPLSEIDKKRRHDYEIFVDASLSGYGAYLLTPKSDVDKTVRWMSEDWPEGVSELYSLKSNTPFLEFYGTLASIYTWKDKFKDKKVLVWSDNKSVVDIINIGIYNEPEDQHVLWKSFRVLQDTCVKSNILVEARHVSRLYNMAADFLSRQQTQLFQEMLSKFDPEVSFKPKKSKKLLFFLPFKDNVEKDRPYNPDE